MWQRHFLRAGSSFLHEDPPCPSRIIEVIDVCADLFGFFNSSPTCNFLLLSPYAVRGGSETAVLGSNTRYFLGIWWEPELGVCLEYQQLLLQLWDRGAGMTVGQTPSAAGGRHSGAYPKGKIHWLGCFSSSKPR